MKSFKNEVKKYWEKFWFLLWKDDSLRGWIFSIIFLFLFIKLIFFPGLNLITGTELPLAIVESCSMYHNGNIFSNFDAWYERHDAKYAGLIINKLDFQDFSLKNGFSKGDILFIIGISPEKLKVGDVIVFDGGQKTPIIHRIIKIEEINGTLIFSTIGDNNNGQLSIEEGIKGNQIIGRAVFRLAPYLGWGKLIFFEFGKAESEKGLCHEN